MNSDIDTQHESKNMSDCKHAKMALTNHTVLRSSLL